MEEIAYLNKWIKKKEIINSIKFYGKLSLFLLKCNLMKRIITTEFKDLIIFEGINHEDSRGFLREVFLENKIKKKIKLILIQNQKKMYYVACIFKIKKPKENMYLL